MANSASLNRRERLWVTGAAVVSDLDGLGLVVELATRHSSHPLFWWSEYHHVLGHNLALGLILSVLSAVCCRSGWLLPALVLASFHTHLLGDLLGGRGPDGDAWPIYYAWPFSRALAWTFTGQWALNAWPNFLITLIGLGITLVLARRRGYSPMEIFSQRADQAVVQALRRRWPDNLDQQGQ